MRVSSKFIILTLMLSLSLVACNNNPPPTPPLQGAIVPTRVTLTPSATPSPTMTLTSTPTSTPTATLTPTETLTATVTETATLTHTPEPTTTETNTAIPPTFAPTLTEVVPPTPVESANVPESDLANPIDIQIDEVIQGEITLNAGSVYYRFPAQAGDAVAIQMRADPDSSLDTYLKLYNADGDIVAENDDAEDGNTNSRIETILESGGDYIVQATRFQEELGSTVGQFELEIIRIDSADLQTNVENFVIESIDIGDVVTGRIDDQTVYFAYLFEADAGDVIDAYLEASSEDLDPYLLLTNASGDFVFAENDDEASGGRNSYIEYFVIPEDGEYAIVATRFDEENGLSFGDFTLYTDSISLPIALGDAYDSELDNNYPVGVYVYEGTAGDVITVRMERSSGDLDPYLIVRNLSGDVLAEVDDISEDNTNSLIDGLELPEDGMYFIVATRADAESQGEYTVYLNATGDADGQTGGTSSDDTGGQPANDDNRPLPPGDNNQPLPPNGNSSNQSPGDMPILFINQALEGAINNETPSVVFRLPEDLPPSISLDVRAPNRRMEAVIALFDAEGRELVRSVSGDARLVSTASIENFDTRMVLPAYVVVGQMPNPGERLESGFRLSMQAGRPDAELVGFTSNPVELGEVIEGNIERLQPMDIYVFYAEEGMNINLAFEILNSLEPAFFVNPPLSLQPIYGGVADSDQRLGDSQLSSSGFYSLTVFAQNGRGDYLLTIEDE